MITLDSIFYRNYNNIKLRLHLIAITLCWIYAYITVTLHCYRCGLMIKGRWPT